METKIKNSRQSTKESAEKGCLLCRCGGCAQGGGFLSEPQILNKAAAFRARAAAGGRSARPSQGEICYSVSSGRGLRSARGSGPAGRELRAFAGRSCGPLRFHSEPPIHKSKFKIQNQMVCRGALEPISSSGRSLRGTQVRRRTAGLRRPQAAACCAHSGAIRQPRSYGLRCFRQNRSRSDRQPAAAPGRRAASSRSSKAGPLRSAAGLPRTTSIPSSLGCGHCLG